MKIIQVYSNQLNFKPARFNEGFNVIIGKVTQPQNINTDTHNLGKSTLLLIIDFLLLKGITKDHFLKRHQDMFKGYDFYLELKTNRGQYLTIKRGVDNSSKVSLKLHEEKYQNFIECKEWNYTDLSISSSDPQKNPKAILNNLLAFNILKGYSYRATLNYFLRSQYDYQDVFQLSKFKGRHVNWKPQLFELLGFDSTCMINKYNFEDQIVTQELFKDEIESKYVVTLSDTDKVKGAIEIKKQERDEISQLIDKFSFYNEERKVTKTLVHDTEEKIAKLNTFEYDLKYEIERLESSRKSNINFSIADIDRIFKEARIHFPGQLKKSYEELLQFNTKLSQEREKYVAKQLNAAHEQLGKIQEELRALDELRGKELSFLQEQDSFKKYKAFQKTIHSLDLEIANLSNRLESIDITKQINEDIKHLIQKVEETASAIADQIDEGNSYYSSIRSKFNNFMKNIVGLSAILSIHVNSSGNVDFKAEIADFTSTKLTSRDQGFSYKKILCACFDLAVLCTYANQSFFRFVYHDGVFESLDNRKKVIFLGIVKDIVKEFDLQYILTLIEHDAPHGIDGFKEDEIALVLDDSPYDKGRLFGLSF